MISNHFYWDGIRYDVIRYDIQPDVRMQPRPIGYRLLEAEDPQGWRCYGWVSPSGVSRIGYTSLEAARQGSWRDHNCAVRLGIPT